MKRMYFNTMAKYDGVFYNAGEIIKVRDEHVESMQKQGGFLVNEEPAPLNQKTTQRAKSKASTSKTENNDGELKPKSKPTRGVKSNG